MSIQRSRIGGQLQLVDEVYDLDLSSYLVDLSSFSILPSYTGDLARRPYHLSPVDNHPTTVVQEALTHWNHYLATSDERYRGAFLAQAYWLVEHEVRIGNDASGWPLSLPLTQFHTKGSWLSASVQGGAISVLLRAYQLTCEENFLQTAHRTVRTFERDILDGGVSIPVGADGIFFEEVAVYPATHMLCGFIFALLGLYDYVALTADNRIDKLIQRGFTTMHSILHEFDAGYWTYSDLLHRHLSSPSLLSLQAILLEALAKRSSCDHCVMLASRWKRYLHQRGYRLRYQLTSCCISYGSVLWKRVQTVLFPPSHSSQAAASTRVCVVVPAFPAMGGVPTVLEGVVQVTKDTWQIEYLTQHSESGQENYIVHRFGTRRMTPWYFPFVWLYVLAGSRKLLSLIHRGADYHILLPQDAVFSGAVAGLVGKLTGTRVVCIDHGDLSLFTDCNSRIYRTERNRALIRNNWPWPVRLIARQLLKLYWPSRYLLARRSTRLVDHFLIPGVAGDSIEEGCKKIGVPLSRITRYGSMIDINRHIIPDALTRAAIREEKGIAADAMVIAIICRLSPEKGLDIALESVSQVLSQLPADLRARVRVVIAGEGPIRRQVEEDIRQRGLAETCLLWGSLSADEVITLLGISDIFLYTSTRGACFSMAVLEAMASTCAVVASTEPLSNALLLSEGRGIAVPAGDPEQTSKALLRLLTDPALCQHMGNLARSYIAVHHSPTLFKRTLQRVTYWSGLDKLWSVQKDTKPIGIENES